MSTNPDFAMHELDPEIGALDPAIRELDHRFNDGIEVTLRWNERTNRVSVSVQDEKLDESFELDVNPEDALAAFRHPYTYSSRAGVDPAFAA